VRAFMMEDHPMHLHNRGERSWYRPEVDISMFSSSALLGRAYRDKAIASGTTALFMVSQLRYLEVARLLCNTGAEMGEATAASSTA
jgi:hypothetical protein